MARITATDIVDISRKRAGNLSETDWSDDDILLFANQAQKRIAFTNQPEWLESSGTITFAASDASKRLSDYDVLRIKAVLNNTDGQRVRPTSREDWVRDNQGTDTITGTVYRYFMAGTEAYEGYTYKVMVPQSVPDASTTLTYYYTRYPTEMVLTPAATSPDLPEEWDESLFDITAEILKKNDQQMREAMLERQLSASTEGKAAAAARSAPERRYGIESAVAPSTKAQSSRAGRSRSSGAEE